MRGGRALREIVYIEIFRREVVVHCAQRTVTGTGSLTSLLEQLPERCFYRSHRSFLVNLDFVAGIRRYCFLPKGGDGVPIAMRAYPEAQRRWLEFVT